MADPAPFGAVILQRGTTAMDGTVQRLSVAVRRHTMGAPLVYAAGDAEVNLQGRLLSRTNKCGSYLLMNAMWFDEPLQDSGSLLCVEPDFGLRKSWGKAQWNLWQTDTANDRKLYQIPGFVFQVEDKKLGDRQAPYVETRFDVKSNGLYTGVDLAKPTDEVYLSILMRDNQIPHEALRQAAARPPLDAKVWSKPLGAVQLVACLVLHQAHSSTLLARPPDADRVNMVLS